MNKDIQALIEREAEKHSATVLPFMRDQSLYTHEMAYSDCVKHGASFALSLFKWNQVTDGYPDDIRDVLFMTTKGIIYMGYYDQMECQWSSVSGERFYTLSITKWMEKP